MIMSWAFNIKKFPHMHVHEYTSKIANFYVWSANDNSKWVCVHMSKKFFLFKIEDNAIVWIILSEGWNEKVLTLDSA